MSRILILNPPTSQNTYINRDQMGGMGQNISFGENFLVVFLRKLKSSFIHQPVLQLVYAATILSKNHQIKVIDSLNEEIDYVETMRRIKIFKPEFTIMAVSSSEIEFEKKIAREIKKLNCKIITVGDTIANKPELFDDSFDVSIEGEVEPVIEKIISWQLDKIPGIMYFKNKIIKTNKKQELMTGKELDNLEFPKWELFPYKKYRYYPLLLQEPIVSMLSSRGCPYGCYYCSYSKNEGRILRNRSAENVVKEMLNLKKYGIKGVIFRDPLFTGDMKRAEEISRLLIKNNSKLVWGCETRPELLTIELLRLMRRAGCRAINLGIESINEKELEAVGRKKIDLKHLIKVLQYCKKIGINTTGFFILGLPESTKKSLNKTINFSKYAGLGFSEYKVATPYPGTKLYEMALKNNWIVNDKWGGYQASMQINKDISPKYLNKLCDRAFKDFYYNPKWVLWQLKNEPLEKMKMFIKSAFRVILSS